MIEHESTDNIVCPYCGEEIEDSWEFEGECGQCKCYECDKTFNWTRYVSVSYSTTFECEKNKEKHKWDEWNLYQFEDKFEEVEDVYVRYCERCDSIDRMKLKDLN